MDILFDGWVTAVDPISITAPPPEGRRGDTLYHTRQVETAAGERLTTLVIPATTLRGKLRRSTVEVVARSAREHGRTWSRDAYYFNVIGQTRSSEQEQEYVPLDEIAKQREANPIVSLYGAGIGLASKLMVSDAVPKNPTEGEEVRGIRKDVDADPSWTMSLLDKDALAEWSTRARANKQRVKVESEVGRLERSLRNASDDEAEGIRAEIERRKTEVARLKEEARTGVSVKLPFSFTAIPAGTVMRHKMRGRNLTPEEMGAFLVGLDGLSLDPVIGGQQARGCGGIAAKYEVKIRESTREPIRPFGSVSIGNFDRAEWKLSDDEARTVLDEARQAFDRVVENAAKLEWRALSDVT